MRDVINGAGVSAAACMADWAVRMCFLEPKCRRTSGKDEQGGSLAAAGAEIRADATAEMDLACQAASIVGGAVQAVKACRGEEVQFYLSSFSACCPVISLLRFHWQSSNLLALQLGKN